MGNFQNTICAPICIPHESSTDSDKLNLVKQGELEASEEDEQDKENNNDYSLSLPLIKQLTLTDDTSELPTDLLSTPKIEHRKLLKEFEASIINRDFNNAMALYEEYQNEKINFLNYEFTNGDKPLHYAIREKNARFVYYLLQKGADPNSQSKYSGDTPIHIATKMEDIRMIVILMKWNASFDIENHVNKTPIDIANELKNEDIIEMYGNTFQDHINHKRNRTVYHYSVNVKPTFGKNEDAIKNIRSAFDTKNTISVPKQRRMWKPKTMKSNQYGGSDTDSDDEYDDGNLNEFEDNIKANKILGVNKDDIKESYKVDDILDKLKKAKSRRIIKKIDNINKGFDELPKLSSWLQKKSPKPPHGYQKRYLCVVDNHLLWNDKRIKLDPQTVLTSKTRNKYSGSLSLLMIKEIHSVDTAKGGYNFNIIAPNAKLRGNKSRTYTWKCKTKELRDDWVNGIKIYCKYLNNELDEYESILSITEISKAITQEW